MCRSIKVLRRPAEPVTPDDISAAALQFVRKVSGYHKPSKMNQAAFDAAVREIAGATNRLLENLAEAQPNRRTPDRVAGV
jgi:hypothetical protein